MPTQDWDMFDSPEEHTKVFAKWKKLLRVNQSSHTMPSTDE